MLQAANWQRVGKRHVPRPKPVTRPGVADPAVQVVGSGDFTTDQMAAIQARWGTKAAVPNER